MGPPSKKLGLQPESRPFPLPSTGLLGDGAARDGYSDHHALARPARPGAMGHDCSTFVLRGSGDAGRAGASPAVDFHAFCSPADTAKGIRRHYSGGGARLLKFVFATEPPHLQRTVNEFGSLTEAGFHYTARTTIQCLE